MKAITCQVSAYRSTCDAAPAGPGHASGPRSGTGSCGSQATAAASAGSAHSPRASGSEPPDAWYTGTAISDATIAPAGQRESGRARSAGRPDPAGAA